MDPSLLGDDGKTGRRGGTYQRQLPFSFIFGKPV